MRRRKCPVKPSFGWQIYNLYPIEVGLGVQHSDEQEQFMDPEGEHHRDELEDLATKYEELREKVEQHFDNSNCKDKRKNFVVNAPPKPNKEEWLRHQATHSFLRTMVQALRGCANSQACTSVKRKTNRNGERHGRNRRSNGKDFN